MHFSQQYRRAIFAWYALKPFQPRMAARQISGRLQSMLGAKAGFRVIDLAIGYKCNLFCDHCSAMGLDREEEGLGLHDYKKIVGQACELGNLSWNITGGEPLLYNRLDELIKILEPSKNYISVQTNCMLLTRERAVSLKRLGVNSITTSLDSHAPEIHNRFRGSNESFERVESGIRYAKEAGMQVLVGGIVTHENIRSYALEKLIRRVNNAGAIFLYNLAVPCGNWHDNDQVILNEDDRRYLKKLLEKYPASSTDHEPGRNQIGCPAGMEKIYITPFGDVLPCPFIHISFGNVREMPLKGIVEKMRKVKQFGGYQRICVAAEDPFFHSRVFPAVESLRAESGPVPCEKVFEEIYAKEQDDR